MTPEQERAEAQKRCDSPDIILITAVAIGKPVAAAIEELKAAGWDFIRAEAAVALAARVAELERQNANQAETIREVICRAGSSASVPVPHPAEAELARLRELLRQCERASAGDPYAWPEAKRAAFANGTPLEPRLDRVQEIVNAALTAKEGTDG